MPTIITSSIGTGGRTYSTIEAWIAACPADLVVADQVWKGECYNDSEFAPTGGTLSFSGKTTDATRYMWLTTAAGQSFQDHAGQATNALRYDQTKGVGIASRDGWSLTPFTVTCPYTLLEKLQFIFDYPSHQAEIKLSGAGTCLRECIAYRTSAYGNSQGVIFIDGSSARAVNVVVIDDAPNAYAFGFNSSSAIVIACTAIRHNSGSLAVFGNEYASPLICNCVGIGAASFGRNGAGVKLNVASDYNASDLPSNPDPNMGQSGTHHLYSLVPANTFTSVGTGGISNARPKAGSLLIGAGFTDTTYTLGRDVMGNIRSTTTPTIGAVEYLGGTVAATFIPFRNTPAMGPIFAQ